jgi:hypothetical protein
LESAKKSVKECKFTGGGFAVLQGRDKLDIKK